MRSVIQTAFRRTLTACMIVVFVAPSASLRRSQRRSDCCPPRQGHGTCIRRSGHESGRERGIVSEPGHSSARRRAPIRRRRHAAASLFDGQRRCAVFVFTVTASIGMKNSMKSMSVWQSPTCRPNDLSRPTSKDETSSVKERSVAKPSSGASDHRRKLCFAHLAACFSVFADLQGHPYRTNCETPFV